MGSDSIFDVFLWVCFVVISQGTVANRPFVMQHMSSSLYAKVLHCAWSFAWSGRPGKWSVSQLPIQLLHGLAPSGSPVEWIKSAMVDMSLESHMDSSKSPFEVVCKTKFVLSDVSGMGALIRFDCWSWLKTCLAHVPPALENNVLIKATAKPIVDYMNGYTADSAYPLTSQLC